MKFIRMYRLSFYLMLLFATLIMCMDATEESMISILFPIGVGVAGVVAYLTVDRHPGLGLSRGAANLLGLASIFLVISEYVFNENKLIIALPHWLVYLQIIKMFLPKTAEDDWFLYLLGLMQVLVGAFISQSDRVGVMLFVWAILALWVLALFSLHRDALRSRGIVGVPASEATLPEEPYPGLLNTAFLFSALRVTLMTLALGGAIFLIMPRRNSQGRAQSGYPIGSHLTGFDEEVQLGQLGEILENDSIVMTIEAYNEDRVRIKPGEEPLWRGVTLADYRGGRWNRLKGGTDSFSQIARPGGPPVHEIRQQIKLEANDSPVLFGLRPILDAKASSWRHPGLNLDDGTIFRRDWRAGSFDYEVLSDADPSTSQPGELLPDARHMRRLREIDEALKVRFQEIARPILQGIPSEDLVARARALEAFFRDSGQFTYTLRIRAVDRKLDPIEDFLVNTREGQCEYFASALTMLLRSIDIPARMVNGFKGGDWNELAQMYSVRQKHAHSWVEAYLGEGPGRTPIWLTLDPTPATERRLSVDQVGGFIANFRQLTDLIRYVWVFYIVGYNAERQNRVLYEPIRELIREARSGFQLMGETLQSVGGDLLHFRKVESLISLPGFLMSFTALLVLVGVFKTGLWLWHRLCRWLRGPDSDATSLSASVVFYRRMLHLLAEYGLERPPAETQSEFARRATVFLTGRGSNSEAVADVPRLIVDAFYRVRFGHLELTPADLKHLETRLDALEASLRSTQA